MTPSTALPSAGQRPPRLVATDLDGTLVGPDGRVSERTSAALGLARSAGARIVFVTGRPVRWMADVVRDTGLAGAAIVSNGALLVDLGSGAVHLRRLLDPAVATAFAADLRSAVPGTAYAVELEDGFAREPGYAPRFDAGQAHAVGPLEQIADGAIVKLLARHERLDSDELLARAAPAAGSRVSVTHSTISGGGLVEIAAAGVSKASTLARYAEQLGLTASDVLAFGDMPNDLAMLSWAGQAYAMANAHPDVLAVVDRVAPGNAEDGVAQVLERIYC